MGSFSFNMADNLGDIENVAFGKPFKFLIPNEFGGGHIVDVYKDYGYLGNKYNGHYKYDMYELLSFWNSIDGLKYNGSEKPLMKEIDEHTIYNRGKGIDLGCNDEDMAKLKYPLKLVSMDFRGTYETCKSYSTNDPDQGFFPRYRDKSLSYEE